MVDLCTLVAAVSFPCVKNTSWVHDGEECAIKSLAQMRLQLWWVVLDNSELNILPWTCMFIEYIFVCELFEPVTL